MSIKPPLGDEVIARLVTGDLTFKDLATSSQVSSVWKNVANEKTLWEEVLKSTYPKYCQSIDDKREAKTVFTALYRFQNFVPTKKVVFSALDPRMQDRHDSEVMFYKIEGKTLFTASCDMTIKMWDLETKTFLRTFTGHTNPVLGLDLSGDYLFSAPMDKDAKMWNWHTGDLVKTFTCPQGVGSLAVTGDRLVTGGSSKFAQLWSTKTGCCIGRFDGHEDLVECVLIKNGFLYTGSQDGTVKKWDIDTLECLKTFEGIKNKGIASIKIHEEHLFVGLYSGDIKMYHIQTGELVRTFWGDGCAAASMEIAGESLIAGGLIGTVKIWEIHTGKLNQLLKTDSDIVSLSFTEGTLYIGTLKYLYIYDFM